MRRSRGCWRPARAGRAIALLWLAGCGPAISEGPICPPVVPYTAEAQARAADEMAALPPGAVLPEMLADYAALRDQLRACRGRA